MVAEYFVKQEKEQGPGNPANDKRLFALVLAAGGSSRFGAVKQLALYAGAPLVTRAVRLAEVVCGPRSVLVTGYQWRDVVDACRPLQGFFVNNIDWRSGMGGSIASGVKSVREAADAVLLMLADQPLVTVDHLRRLVTAWEESNSIVATSFAGTQGPPVIFPGSSIADLAALTGDQGARAVFRKAKGRVHCVAFEAAAIDVDAPGDLEGLTEP